MKTAIWWVRRDLRLTDNQALHAALNAADWIIPVFIYDPRLWSNQKFGNFRLSFLNDGLTSLDANLQSRGSRLVLRSGDPLIELTKIVLETGAQIIYAEEDYSPYAKRRDNTITQQLPLKLTPGLTVFHPRQLQKSDGSPYTVFTPFMRAWKSMSLPNRSEILPAVDQIPTPVGTISDPQNLIQEQSKSELFPAGERYAQISLDKFIGEPDSPIYRYKINRDRPDISGTSRLSPYIRFGMISSRQLVVTALESMYQAQNSTSVQGAETWLNELIWREFYNSILYHFPNVLRKSFKPNLESIRWSNNKDDFEAWKNGKTGFPLVDAAMRQLRETGWMHNRCRMIVASFLVKNLLIDWRWGERWFMQLLIDGDPAANNGGWQWTAGTGTDAAPYFRIFNPITQSKKFDPDGKFIRQWLPELHLIPIEFVHEPWKMPVDVQKQSKCQIGEHYPNPIIELNWSRQRVLDAYNKAQKTNF
jgi:deoxyribodipyrimidine photo-lyase